MPSVPKRRVSVKRQSSLSPDCLRPAALSPGEDREEGRLSTLLLSLGLGLRLALSVCVLTAGTVDRGAKDIAEAGARIG
jgi:hypothetical protein